MTSIRTFFTGNQLESITSWSLKDPMKVSITSLMLNMHTAEPLIALTGVLNTPYTIGSVMPVRAVLKTSLVPSTSVNKRFREFLDKKREICIVCLIVFDTHGFRRNKTDTRPEWNN